MSHQQLMVWRCDLSRNVPWVSGLYTAAYDFGMNALALARTPMARFVLDAGRSLFRSMLQYKADYAGVWCEDVDESYSIQNCICCNRRAGPKGRQGLGISERACVECGAYHHRDLDAAVSILVAGRRRLVEEILILPRMARQPTTESAEDVKSVFAADAPFRPQNKIERDLSLRHLLQRNEPSRGGRSR
ncbi:transposase [Paraburkholderia franconis]|uniref:transposase n=1 Tax=Paraburkholderia franconis TaxID=2654983 RepID=UPI002AB31341|nr:transposase [Paraburkholderia franconis]